MKAAGVVAGGRISVIVVSAGLDRGDELRKILTYNSRSAYEYFVVEHTDSPLVEQPDAHCTAFSAVVVDLRDRDTEGLLAEAHRIAAGATPIIALVAHAADCAITMTTEASPVRYAVCGTLAAAPDNLRAVIDHALDEALVNPCLDAGDDADAALNRILFDRATHPIVVLDLESRFLDANQAALDFFETPLDELRTLDVAAFAPADRATIAGQYKELWRTGGQFEVECSVHGERKFLDITIAPVIRGASTAVYAIGADKTMQRLTMLRLQEAERRLRTMLDTINLLAVGLDRNGRVNYCNFRLLDVLGVSYEEILGQDWFVRCIPPDERDEVRGVFTRLMNGQAITPFTNRMGTADGSVRTIEWNNTVLYDFRGQPSGTMSIGIDLTERLAVQRNIEHSERRYRQLFESGSDAVFVNELRHDRLPGRCVEVNEVACRLFGFPRRELIGLPMSHLVAPDQRAEFDIQAGPLSPGEKKRFEIIGFTHSGQRIPLDVQTTLFTIDGQEIALSIVRDITDLRQREEVLHTTLDTLRLTLIGAIEAMSTMVEKRDPYTAGHQKRVAKLAVAIARELGLSEKVVEGILMAGIVHDIGKISIPAEILTKPGSLTMLEYNLMKLHPELGFDIVKNISFPWPVAEIVIQHHERMDGTGYPQGLAEDEIRMESRIISVADVVEAIASDRPYRAAVGIEAGLREIDKFKGSRYDTDVVNACLRLFREKEFRL